MIEVSSKNKRLDINRFNRVIKRSLDVVTRESWQEVLNSTEENFILRRQWLKRGIRYKINSSENYIYSKDKWLEKQEEGGAYSGDSVVPLSYWRNPKRSIPKSKQPRTDDSLFWKDRVLFERLKNKIRPKYIYTKSAYYEPRLSMEKNIDRVVNSRFRVVLEGEILKDKY